MGKAARDIIASLQNEPEEWRLGGYTWMRDDGIEIWRANMPIFSIELSRPTEMSFGICDKFRIYLAFRRWQKNMPLAGYGND